RTSRTTGLASSPAEWDPRRHNVCFNFSYTYSDSAAAHRPPPPVPSTNNFSVIIRFSYRVGYRAGNWFSGRFLPRTPNLSLPAAYAPLGGGVGNIFAMDLSYPIGKLESPQSVTPAERAQHIAEVEKAPAQLRLAVPGLDDGQLDTPYRPGGWTVR